MGDHGLSQGESSILYRNREEVSSWWGCRRLSQRSECAKNKKTSDFFVGGLLIRRKGAVDVSTDVLHVNRREEVDAVVSKGASAIASVSGRGYRFNQDVL